MIIERTEHPQWLSNAYLVADREGGHGVLVDSNGINQPLIDAVDRLGVTVTHVLVTHHHHDHVVTSEDDARHFGVGVLAHPLARTHGVHVDETIEDGDVIRSGELEIRAIATPGHCDDQLALLVDGTDCLTTDCLFKGTVGGCTARGDVYEIHRRSIMENLMSLPPETRIHPGHTLPSTIGEEWESNPFIRIWRGVDPEGSEPCTVNGEEATLVLWGPDYDGTHKAWVRFADGDQIVGGSRVTRSS